MSRIENKQQTAGFTIVELLIVIVVIGILAAITIVAYNGIQQRATATSIVSTIKQIEKGFILQATISGQSEWWNENDFSSCAQKNIPTDSGTVHMNIETIRTGCSFPNLPVVNEDSTIVYGYDNESDIDSGCELVAGANIVITGDNMNQSLAEAVDKAIDGNVGTCGSVAYYDYQNAIFFTIANDPSKL